MVMYDKATESWWQQFLGEALIGALTGTRMDLIPARLESLANFGERAPNGLVLVPENSFARAYGTTPYTGMDTAKVSRARFPYPLPDGVEPPCPGWSSSVTRPGPLIWCAMQGASTGVIWC